MTGRPPDERLEHEVRALLRRRDPGAAPDELRARVLDVPERTQPSQPSQPRRPLTAVLGLAAVILLAVIGLTTIRHVGGPGGTATPAPSSPGSSSSPAVSPAGAFDPALEGIGISATDDASPAFLVVIACAVLGTMAITARGRRRFVPAVVGVVLAGWAIVGSFVPVTVLDSGYGLGLSTVRASQVPGSGEELLYELAPANGRFSLGLYLMADGPLPIRIEGVVSPAFDHRDRFIGMLLTALWIDREPNGGMTGPIRPFAPFEMPRNGQSIWIVGRAGACALGSAFDPSNAATVGFQSIDSLDVRVSVLGWPRTVHLALPFRLVEPEPETCSGPSPGPSSSRGAQ